MPLKSIADINPSLNLPLIALSRFLTPHRFRRNERRAFTADDFDDVHRSIAELQFEYVGWPRADSVRVRGAWFQHLAPSRAYLLNAANVEARISFAKTAVHEVLRLLEDVEETVFFFSVCPRRFVLPLHDANQVDLHALRKLTGQALAGTSFVGAVDFALFKGFGRHQIRAWHNHVGAHTHGLVWAASMEELLAKFAAMGPEFINLKGECAGYVQRLEPDEIAGYMRYALKLPLFEYNVTAGGEERVDLETGEITRATKISANPLRPGDQLRLAALLHDISLDHLIFGQHGGTAVVREIRRRTRQPITQRNELAARRGLPPSAQIGIDEILSVRRTPVSDLIKNPPRKVWLGPVPAIDRIEPFLHGRAATEVRDRTIGLPGSVFG